MRRDADMRFPFEVYSSSGAGVVVAAHCNERRMEITEVVSGSAMIQIGTEYVEVSEGDMVYVPAGAVTRVFSESGASVRGIIFESDIIEANMVNYETEILYMFYVQSKNRIKVFDAEHPSYCVLKRCLL